MLERKLANNLKVLRAQNNLTQEALANKVGVTRKTINVIEAGDYAPSVALAIAIAETLDVPVGDIFYFDD